MTTAETTVREIALDNPAAIRVFEKFGIDYCCGGRKPLAQACEERAIEPAAVLAAIEATATPAEATGPDWNTGSLGELCRHIVETHHAYVRAEIPRLQFFAEKVLSRHGNTHPELARIRELSHNYTAPEGACPTYRGFFQALADFERDLHHHVHLENNILFPRAIELEESVG